MGMGMGGGASPYGGAGKGCGGGGGGGGGKKPTGTGQYMNGIVKSFNQGSNYGFIACEEVKIMYGKDVFCGGNQLAQYPAGTPVIFHLGLNEQGQPQALEVTATA
eukprot:TRINITY_DN16797_c1_g5_i1.p1 TRINITY_DN16797_c1_g5~~TRINITY_DN16797_c1_g5_i1.p1  ORF type:complete len:123 (+),score=46.98 TRINITY_DN16797_c1_g5_i1:55-369(+)